MHSKQKGFTLIELLVVIAIIAILAAILFPVFAKAREKARQTKCTSNQRQIVMAVQMFIQENDETFPTCSTFWGTDMSSVAPKIKACPDSNDTIGYLYNGGLNGAGEGEIDPTSTFVTVDGVSRTQSGDVANIAYQNSQFKTRHGGKVIASFADGHVELRDASAVWVRGAYFATGGAVREVWENGTQTDLSNLPTGVAAKVSFVTSLQGPTNAADNYTSRIRGYLFPPATGAYTFWISSDDGGELYLSTNESRSAIQRVAYVSSWTNPLEWGKEANQKSSPVTLTQGKVYYFEVRQFDGGGGDNLAVGWDKPGEDTSAPSEIIPGTVLGAY